MARLSSAALSVGLVIAIVFGAILGVIQSRPQPVAIPQNVRATTTNPLSRVSWPNEPTTTPEKLTGLFSAADLNTYCVNHQSGGPYGSGPYGARGTQYKVDKVDLATFQIVLDSGGNDSGYAKDKFHVYASCDGAIPDADPYTFVPLNDYPEGGSYVKDASHVWYVTAPGGELGASWGFSVLLISAANVPTFETPGATDTAAAFPGADASDANHYYQSGQVLGGS